MNDNKENIEQVLEAVTFDDAPDQEHQDLLENKLLLNFNAVQPRHKSTWRIIMNTKMSKLAAAAVIVLGVFVGFGIFTETSSVSWAQVRQQVAAVKAVIYKAKINATENYQRYFFRFFFPCCCCCISFLAISKLCAASSWPGLSFKTLS